MSHPCFFSKIKIIFQVRDEFEESVEMSTYLVAFVVCDFTLVSKMSKKNVNVSVIASPDKIDQVFISFFLSFFLSYLQSGGPPGRVCHDLK